MTTSVAASGPPASVAHWLGHAERQWRGSYSGVALHHGRSHERGVQLPGHRGHELDRCFHPGDSNYSGPRPFRILLRRGAWGHYCRGSYGELHYGRTRRSCGAHCHGDSQRRSLLRQHAESHWNRDFYNGTAAIGSAMFSCSQCPTPTISRPRSLCKRFPAARTLSRPSIRARQTYGLHNNFPNPAHHNHPGLYPHAFAPTIRPKMILCKEVQAQSPLSLPAWWYTSVDGTVPTQDDMTCAFAAQQVTPPTATVTFVVQTYVTGGPEYSSTVKPQKPNSVWPGAAGGAALAALVLPAPFRPPAPTSSSAHGPAAVPRSASRRGSSAAAVGCTSTAAHALRERLRAFPHSRSRQPPTFTML